jgi:hypothetical protein
MMSINDENGQNNSPPVSIPLDPHVAIFMLESSSYSQLSRACRLEEESACEGGLARRYTPGN